MKDYERLAVAAFTGALVAYLIGVLATRWTGSPLLGSSLCILVTVAAMYVGWLWAQKGRAR